MALQNQRGKFHKNSAWLSQPLTKNNAKAKMQTIKPRDIRSFTVCSRVLFTKKSNKTFLRETNFSPLTSVSHANRLRAVSGHLSSNWNCPSPEHPPLKQNYAPSLPISTVIESTALRAAEIGAPKISLWRRNPVFANAAVLNTPK